MDQSILPPPIQTSTDKKISIEEEELEIIEEEEEEFEIQTQTKENVEENTTQKVITSSLMDEVTQTDSTVFEKIQDDLAKQNQESKNSNQTQVHSLTQTELIGAQIDTRDQYDKFMEREFYPQFKANEEKIDSQIERIDDAIAKLRYLTDNFNHDIEVTPSTSTSASIDHLSDSLQVHSVKHLKGMVTPKKPVKKIKAKAISKTHTKTISTIPVQSTKLKKKSRKKSVKRHKRFVSPLKMTTEKRLGMLMRKKSPDQDNVEDQIDIPRGTSQYDPIVLRSGYPIVFDYDPKEPVRHERIPHGPMRTLYKNGDLKFEFHDGTVRIKTHNGFTYTYYTNGDKQQEFPDGVNAYRYNSNGSVEFRCPDKTLMYFFQNGQIEEHFSNGETRVRFPDRSEVRILVDNSYIFKDRNGNRQRGKIFNESLNRNPYASPSSPGSPNGISAPTPRKNIPVSTSLASQDPDSNDNIHATPKASSEVEKKE